MSSNQTSASCDDRARRKLFGVRSKRAIRLLTDAILVLLLAVTLSTPILSITLRMDGLIDSVLSSGEFPITKTQLVDMARMIGIDLLSIEQRERYSVIGGIRILYEHGAYAPAVIIVLFSVILPIVKLARRVGIDLGMLGLRSCRAGYWLSHLNRLAMLDVFVIALIVLALAGSFGIVTDVGIAFYSFAVFVTLFAVTEPSSRHLPHA